MEAGGAQLVSRSATTRRFQFRYGELWILPDALARLSMGWWMSWRQAQALRRSGRRPTVPPIVGSPVGTDPPTIERLAKSRRDNRWIAREDMRSARLSRGAIMSVLTIGLAGGGTMRLLWLTVDPATEVVPRILAQWLGDEMKAVDRVLAPAVFASLGVIMAFAGVTVLGLGAAGNGTLRFAGAALLICGLTYLACMWRLRRRNR